MIFLARSFIRRIVIHSYRSLWVPLCCWDGLWPPTWSCGVVFRHSPLTSWYELYIGIKGVLRDCLGSVRSLFWECRRGEGPNDIKLVVTIRSTIYLPFTLCEGIVLFNDTSCQLSAQHDLSGDGHLAIYLMTNRNGHLLCPCYLASRSDKLVEIFQPVLHGHRSCQPQT